jgi:hypothetical protein
MRMNVMPTSTLINVEVKYNIPMMRVLCTGSTGFVGFWLGVTQPKMIDATYLNKEQYQEGEWRKTRWDAIIHAALVSPSYALECTDKLLFISSGAVYEGKSEYADNKRKWENLCGDQIIARLFTFIGSHLKNHYAITQFLEAARLGKPLEVWGTGETVRSYLHGLDMGNWLWKILLEGNGVYDVGSFKPIRMIDLAVKVAANSISKIQFVNPDSPTSVYLPKQTRALELGCREIMSLDEEIRRTIHADSRLLGK